MGNDQAADSFEARMKDIVTEGGKTPVDSEQIAEDMTTVGEIGRENLAKETEWKRAEQTRKELLTKYRAGGFRDDQIPADILEKTPLPKFEELNVVDLDYPDEEYDHSSEIGKELLRVKGEATPEEWRMWKEHESTPEVQALLAAAPNKEERTKLLYDISVTWRGEMMRASHIQSELDRKKLLYGDR